MGRILQSRRYEGELMNLKNEIQESFPDMIVSEEIHGDLYSLVLTIPDEPSFQVVAADYHDIPYIAINSYIGGISKHKSWVLPECIAFKTTVWTGCLFATKTSSGQSASKMFCVVFKLKSTEVKE